MAVVALSSASPHNRGLKAALLLPGLLGLALSFLLPLAWLLRISFGSNAKATDWTLQHYASVLADTFYWKVAFNTFLLAGLVAVLAVLLSYPIALFLARTQSRWRGALVALAIAPLLTSTVVRTYGWMVILGDQGLVNGGLHWLGLIADPLPISNNFFAAVVALTELLMPYAILAMLSGLGRLHADYEDAAALLGANRWRVLWRIVLPLSLPGIATGALLVFVLALSSFVTPRLVGGGRVFVLATEIYGEATVTLQWPLAATLAILLLLLFGSVITLYQRVLTASERRLGEAERRMALSSKPLHTALYRSFIALLYLFLLAPIVIVFVVSFDTRPYLSFPPESLSLASYRLVLQNEAFLHAFRISMGVGLAAAALALAAGTGVALALRRPGRGNGLLGWLFVSPLLVPNIVLGVALLLVLSVLGLLDSWAGLVLAHTGITLPYVVRTVSMGLRAVDPRCEEAARTLGASPATVFRRITLPLIAPGVVAGGVIAFLISFDEAVISLFITGTRTSTLPVEVYRYIEYRTDPQVAALSVLLILVSVVAVVVVERLLGLRKALQ